MSIRMNKRTASYLIIFIALIINGLAQEPNKETFYLELMESGGMSGELRYGLIMSTDVKLLPKYWKAKNVNVYIIDNANAKEIYDTLNFRNMNPNFDTYGRFVDGIDKTVIIKVGTEEEMFLAARATVKGANRFRMTDYDQLKGRLEKFVKDNHLLKHKRPVSMKQVTGTESVVITQ